MLCYLVWMNQNNLQLFSSYGNFILIYNFFFSYDKFIYFFFFFASANNTDVDTHCNTQCLKSGYMVQLLTWNERRTCSTSFTLSSSLHVKEFIQRWDKDYKLFQGGIKLTNYNHAWFTWPTTQLLEASNMLGWYTHVHKHTHPMNARIHTLPLYVHMRDWDCSFT